MGAALATGNRVIFKPFKHTPAPAEVIRGLLTDALPEDLDAVVSGNADAGREFAALQFDHLLFARPTAVGRRVMMADSANLTLVKLELGSKSPVLALPLWAQFTRTTEGN